MNAPVLPGPLKDNPSLARWVAFPAPGQVAINTGRVEIGQGVLTAMVQIAADELDVAMTRIAIRSGSTAVTPNEGYTAGSQSIQFGGVAMRQACADVRALFLAQAAKVLACPVNELSIRDGSILRKGASTGQDYWTLAGAVDLNVDAGGSGARKPIAELESIGTSSARLDLPAKIFGDAIFIHDMRLPGMQHARVVRQPNRGATIGSVDERAILRVAKAPVAFVRQGNFLAILGDDETAVDLAAVAADSHVKWQNVETPTAIQQEANWLLQRPAVDRVFGAEPADAKGRERFERTYSRGYLAHASISPSCGLAHYDNGHLTVWTHCQGVFPLRAALVKTLGLEASAITVHHVQGSGCYGHNGSDDAAADAAIVAMQLPGKPIRVRWRREEEFIYEPKTPAMIVKVHALLDEAGKPTDWTQEIWSPTHNQRPGAGGNLLGALALPHPPPEPPPNDVPESNGGGATRNAEPLYDIAAKRHIHHLVTETPVRTSALRGLGAMPNVFALECCIDELAERAGVYPVAYRLAITADQRARAVIEKVAAMANWQAGEPGGAGRGRGIAFARYKNRAAYAACVVELDVDEEIRLRHVWCATDAGLVINPDGVINQLEGGIIQSASWVLKEQVRFDNSVALGHASFDWETYPVLKFSEVPEIDIELINTKDEVPLGVGEVTAGPTAAAIGNAVSHALGTRIRDLPLTRERIMASLLKE
ncbi:MAG: xanthine dehydrogenase family protein molybdopterin-binding subunit [Rhizobiales bacterium]|nr:xanthine dehydrogenase family protein molybdopterin-binding subunit [Hyphomicrobiales bacterium]